MGLAFTFRRSEYAGISLGAASGSLIFAALPFVVGAAISAFGDPAQAGIAASLELLAMGIGSIAISAGLRFLPCRGTSLIAAIALFIGHSLSALAVMRHSWTLLLVARLIAGLGEGSLFTICNTFAAKAPRPDRAYTSIAFCQTILGALFFTTMAFVNAQYDPVRVFVLFAAFTLLIVPASLFSPHYRTVDDVDVDNGPRTRFSPTVLRMLVGFAVYSVGLFMLFPYVENIGTTRGFSHSEVASILAISTIAALTGPVINAGLGLRFGRARPILVAIAFQIAACITLVYGNNLILWGGAELTSIVLLYVLSPMMYGLIAHLEPSGRASAIATALMAITAAIGPAISSAVLSASSSYVALGWFNAAIYVLMALIVFGPARKAGKRAAAEPQPSTVTV